MVVRKVKKTWSDLSELEWYIVLVTLPTTSSTHKHHFKISRASAALSRRALTWLADPNKHLGGVRPAATSPRSNKNSPHGTSRESGHVTRTGSCKVAPPQLVWLRTWRIEKFSKFVQYPNQMFHTLYTLIEVCCWRNALLSSLKHNRLVRLSTASSTELKWTSCDRWENHSW